MPKEKYDSRQFWIEYGKPETQQFVKEYPVFRYGREDVFRIIFPFIKSASAVLDCGCGQGYFIQFVLKLQPRKTILGIDISKHGIRFSKVKRCIVADATSMPFREKTFDAMYFITVLQHLEEKLVSNIGSEVNRVLKDAGYFLIYEAISNVSKRTRFNLWVRPNKQYEQLLQMKLAKAIDGINYFLAFRFSRMIPENLRHLQPFFLVFKIIQNLEVFFSRILGTRTKSIELLIFRKRAENGA